MTTVNKKEEFLLKNGSSHKGAVLFLYVTSPFALRAFLKPKILLRLYIFSLLWYNLRQLIEKEADYEQ